MKFLFVLFLGFFLVFQSCQTPGCTDPAACNYDPTATVNNNLFDADLKIHASYVNCAGAASDAFTNLKSSSPTLNFSAVQYSNLFVYTASVQTGTMGFCSVPSGDQISGENAIPSTTATGASQTGWDWTWMHLNGFL